MGTFKLLCRDVIEALRPLPPNLFHGCLCDPPYGLKFMGKRWDHGVPGVEYWSEVLRVLKPGAPIFAFGGSRTYHRLACAIEDAGFEIFDSILGSVWIQGQGFPKGLSLEKTIREKARAQAEHDVRFVHLTYLSSPVYACKECGQVLLKIVQKQNTPEQGTAEAGRDDRGQESSLERWSDLETSERKLLRCAVCTMSHGILADGAQGQIHSGAPIGNGSASQTTAVENRSGPSHRPQSEQQHDREPDAVFLERRAQTFRGYNVCLKPSWEPVVFARKPLSGTYVENCIEHGCGGLNIDGTRIECDWSTDPTRRGWQGRKAPDRGMFSDGKNIRALHSQPNTGGRYPANLILSHHPDDDTNGCHPECPVAALDRQSGNRRSPAPYVRKSGSNKQGVYSPIRSRDGEINQSYGDNGGASRFFQQSAWALGELLEMAYHAKVSTAERNAGLSEGRTNSHSTLKPLSLTTYLAKLILPPPHVSSRLLAPFCGTGSEMAGALIAGWGHVVGIDNDPESIETARDRIPGLITRGTK